ncbi:AbrB/MazE/SpoVT family DNA-binding domain-containing protein [Patescibacteria group bacterium]|nr:AbrB/MazE/SpoVT family DNA-binding domain-containing protein [Patescibacteria group bacterium]MBU1256708.1 AbrB/MazE/SpoVT family DNA-binding domain-containing protein [Patescibacteria group bacterium]MBU1457431.1 AbrB/MazE/SpoVT family DNA-binding domain-containing protein [Patescibacteria group bacterium]
MYTATVTSKGQFTLPAPLRKRLNIQTTDKITLIQKDQGIYIQKIPYLSSLFGSLHNPNTRPLTSQQMKRLTAEKMFSDQK